MADDEISQKVEQWLAKEGYPLEFYTANAFKKHGFWVRQGTYVRTEGEKPREIDLVACLTRDASDTRRFIRCYNVVECKWSRDKPWVIFATDMGMMPSAAIAQAISSETGCAAVWANSGEKKLQNLSIFDPQNPIGFGGRQAFGDKQDRVFSALSSVTSASFSLISEYNRYKDAEEMPSCMVFAFPVIVLDGLLFEASYDAENDKVILSPREQIRCQWEGSQNSELLANIDIVTKESLHAFVQKRREEMDLLLNVVAETEAQLASCFREGSLKALTVKPGARGVLGLPPFLAGILDKSKAEDEAPKA